MGVPTDRPVLHVHVDPSTEWTDAQYSRHLELYEAEFGLADQPRLAVFHRKHGRGHRHYVYSLVRRDGRIIDLSHDHARREKISRILEHELGASHVPGKHNRAVAAALLAEGRHDVVAGMISAGLLDVARPVARMTPAERHQADRTKVDPHAIGCSILAAWDRSDDGPSFKDQLEQRGLDLAIGDKVPVMVDRTGNTHPLARLLGKTAKAETGIRIQAAEVRQRLAGLDLASIAMCRRNPTGPDVVADLEGAGMLPPEASLDALVDATVDLVAIAAQELASGAECPIPAQACALDAVADILDDAAAEMVARVAAEDQPTLIWNAESRFGESAVAAVAEVIGHATQEIWMSAGTANVAAAAMHDTISEAASIMAACDGLATNLDAASVPVTVECFDAPDHVPPSWHAVGHDRNGVAAASTKVQKLPQPGRAHGTPVPQVPEIQPQELNDVGEHGKRGSRSELNLGEESHDPSRGRDIRAGQRDERRRGIPGDVLRWPPKTGPEA